MRIVQEKKLFIQNIISSEISIFCFLLFVADERLFKLRKRRFLYDLHIFSFVFVIVVDRIDISRCFFYLHKIDGSLAGYFSTIPIVQKAYWYLLGEDVGFSYDFDLNMVMEGLICIVPRVLHLFPWQFDVLFSKAYLFIPKTNISTDIFQGKTSFSWFGELILEVFT